jgi:hypothetical protein
MPQNSEQRQAERYDKSLDVTIDFHYRATTEMQYQIRDEDPHSAKYPAVSKNICATGLCLTSHQQLKKGQHLHLEVFLPSGRAPIHMDGEVCWCSLSSSKGAKNLFDAGVRVEKVEGQSVEPTVHLDAEHQILWSNVLESIFGTFRILMHEKTGEV